MYTFQVKSAFSSLFSILLPKVAKQIILKIKFTKWLKKYFQQF
jgi:hypothetical protein